MIAANSSSSIFPVSSRRRSRRASLVGAKQVEEGVRVEPLALAEVAEGLEDVGGQDAAEVDEQRALRAHASLISLAFSASAGTPSSNSARYSSSLSPAW